MLVTREDYFNYSGIDLDIEFKGGPTDNPSNCVDIFLKKVETFVTDYIKLNYFHIQWDNSVLKKAILEQIDYVLLNYDDGKLSDKAKMTIKLGGMGNVTRG